MALVLMGLVLILVIIANAPTTLGWITNPAIYIGAILVLAVVFAALKSRL